MQIGVLALQGNFEQHCQAIFRLQHTPVLVKTARHLHNLSGLILPGGESTTNIRLLDGSDLKQGIFNLCQQNKPIFGTCAGLILLAKNVTVSQFSFGVLDVTVSRNAYGSQKDSFIEEIMIESLGVPPMPCVFIRAPQIIQTAPQVESMATYKNMPILVRQGNILGSTFHPEMTDDLRIHQLFVRMCS